MKTTAYIARRYLFSKKHISLISTLTIISVTGVTIGTALLIVVLSVFNGFFDLIKGLLLENDPDIRIESVEGAAFSYRPENRQETIPKVVLADQSLDSMLSGQPEIQIASAYVEGKALLAYDRSRDRVVQVKGIEADTYDRLNRLSDKMVSGALSLEVADGMPGVVLSEGQMSDLGLRRGDEIALLSASGMRKALTQFSVPRTYRFEVRGSYRLSEIADESPVYVSLEAAQRLFDFRHTVSGIDIRLRDHEAADRVKSEMEERLGETYRVSTWYDLQKPLYDVMYLEKWGSYIILMIIVLVAVLNIVGSLTMIVIQKTRDIGVLMTMGYRPRDISNIFLRQGLYIGLIGCGLGGAIGLLLSWMQQEYGLIKLSSAFIIDAYPASIDPVDVSIILIGSLLLCLAASWYPAKRAAKVEPADAVRNE